jgi:hypothetical protein
MLLAACLLRAALVVWRILQHGKTKIQNHENAKNQRTGCIQFTKKKPVFGSNCFNSGL